MCSWEVRRKIEKYVHEFIKAGSLPTVDVASVEEALRSIPITFYRWLREKRPSAFAFLSEEPFPSAMAFIRALALAEKKKLCPFPGSVSLLIPAFLACQCRKEEEVAAIADWIVANHENPYTPFNFRRTRTYWESARQGSLSPLHTLHRVREMEAGEARAKALRAVRHEAHEAIKRLQKGDSPESQALREEMLREMEREILDQ
jgi:hypothetical protein